jgi:hypothetical protein
VNAAALVVFDYEPSLAGEMELGRTAVGSFDRTEPPRLTLLSTLADWFCLASA